MKDDAVQALITLSAWAADYKAGVIPDEKVHAVIAALVQGLGVPESDTHKVQVQAMRYWMM